MSGTLILLKEAGFAIHYMNLANGCCGTTEYDAETITKIRRKKPRPQRPLPAQSFTKVSVTTWGSFMTDPRWPSSLRSSAMLHRTFC